MDDLYVMIRGRRDVLVYALDKSLAQAVSAARERPGRKVRLPLSHGLTIQLYFKSDEIHVLLSRRGDKAPSQQEARTVLEKWPEPVPPVTWVQGATKHFSFLSAIWPAPKPAQQLPLGQEPPDDHH